MDVSYISSDILTLAALVAALVGVAKGYGISAKHAPLLALIFASVFVLVPDNIQEKITLISVVGLTASGAYNYTKKRSE